MKTQMILFDLDGTLLPMDMDVFTTSYFKLLAAKAAPHGYTDSQALVDGVWSGRSHSKNSPVTPNSIKEPPTASRTVPNPSVPANFTSI